MVMRILLAVAFVVTLARPSMGQRVSFRDLQKRVINGANQGALPVNEPKFDWSGETMIYTLKPSCETTTQSDPAEYPLNEMLTIAAIRKHRFVSQRSRRFWEGRVFPRVEPKITEMIDLINSVRLRGEELNDELRKSSLGISNIYHEELNALARREGKQGARASGGDCAIHIVNVRPEPDAGTVKYMRSGAYLLHKCYNDREPSWSDSKWETAPLNGNFTIGEKTRFWVKWGNGRQQAGLISAQQDGFTWTLVASSSRGFSWER